MSAMLSPCTGVCTIATNADPLPGHCMGCGRTLLEIASWRDLDEIDRLTIMDALPGRLRHAGTRIRHEKQETAVP